MLYKQNHFAIAPLDKWYLHTHLETWLAKNQMCGECILHKELSQIFNPLETETLSYLNTNYNRPQTALPPTEDRQIPVTSPDLQSRGTINHNNGQFKTIAMWRCSFGRLLLKLSYSNVKSWAGRWGVTGEKLKSINDSLAPAQPWPDGFSILEQL